jgi:hypothetical protein
MLKLGQSMRTTFIIYSLLVGLFGPLASAVQAPSLADCMYQEIMQETGNELAAQQIYLIVDTVERYSCQYPAVVIGNRLLYDIFREAMATGNASVTPIQREAIKPYAPAYHQFLVSNGYDIECELSQRLGNLAYDTDTWSIDRGSELLTRKTVLSGYRCASG